MSDQYINYPVWSDGDTCMVCALGYYQTSYSWIIAQLVIQFWVKVLKLTLVTVCLVIDLELWTVCPNHLILSARVHVNWWFPVLIFLLLKQVKVSIYWKINWQSVRLASCYFVWLINKIQWENACISLCVCCVCVSIYISYINYITCVWLRTLCVCISVCMLCVTVCVCHCRLCVCVSLCVCHCSRWGRDLDVC